MCRYLAHLLREIQHDKVRKVTEDVYDYSKLHKSCLHMFQRRVDLLMKSVIILKEIGNDSVCVYIH